MIGLGNLNLGRLGAGALRGGGLGGGGTDPLAIKDRAAAVIKDRAGNDILSRV